MKTNKIFAGVMASAVAARAMAAMQSMRLRCQRLRRAVVRGRR